MVSRLKLKGIDGGSHKRWSMLFNSRQREEPYPGLTCWDYPCESRGIALTGVTSTGAAWLSSARVVRCWVQSRNERNPCRLLLTCHGEHSDETAGDKPEEGGDDVKSSWSLRPGRQTCYNGRYREKRYREMEQIFKAVLSSDWRLQFASMKLESLVTADQPCRGECVPEPCTHRPSSHPSWEYPKSGENCPAEGKLDEGD